MPSNFEAVALPETPAEGDETAARFEESVQLWKDIVGLSKTTAEARFFLRCGGGDVGRAVNVYFEDPNRFTRQPRLSKKDTDSEGGGAGGGGVLWRKKSWRVSSSNNGASRSSSTDTNTNRNDSLNGYLNDSGDYDPSDDEDTISTSAPLLSRFPSNLTMATGATSSTGGRSDGSVGFTTPDTPSTSESLPDEDLLGLAKGFFRLNQVLAMCCFLDQKVNASALATQPKPTWRKHDCMQLQCKDQSFLAQICQLNARYCELVTSNLFATTCSRLLGLP